MSVKLTVTSIEGKKGCFARGTMISMGDGSKKPIENVQVNDEVICFSYHKYYTRKVLEIHHHDTKDTEDELIRIHYDDTYIDVTTNHLIYIEPNVYLEAQQLKVNDVISGYIIKEIHPIPRPLHTFTLSVEEYPTFIANGIMVHNKGGGKGASHIAVEDENTLFSRQTVKVLNVVSEGEIQSVDNVYFDDTLINSYVGSLVETRLGTSTQLNIPGYSAVESEIGVGLEVKNAVPITKSVSGLIIDAVRVTVGVNSLFIQDTSTGDTHGREVTLVIHTRPNSAGIWAPIKTVKFAGKTMKPYYRAIRIEAPTGAGLWEFKITRTSVDDTRASTGSATILSSYTEIQDIKLSYNGTALVGISADAESTGGKIPVTSFDITGLKIKIPNNYNPVTRAYVGSWNGTFNSVKYYCNNPAWVLYDMLTAVRYGLGKRIAETQIDKFAFYQAAVYCDQLVDNGNGGTEPRFTFNGILQQRDSAIKVLQSIASVMRCYIIELGGIISVVQDRPTNVSYLITNNDVIDGMFDYQSSAIKGRHTSVNMSYNDPNDRYLLKTITETDTAGVARYGLNTIDDVAYACTSEGQARRQAKWKLYTELQSLETCVFKVGLRNCVVLPGEVINIQDQDLAEIKYNGVIVSSTTTSITIDSPLLLNNEIYTIQFTTDVIDNVSSSDSYGKMVIATRQIIQTNGSYSTFSWTTPTAAVPLVNSSIIISGSIVPKPFKIVSIKESDSNIFEVSAIQYTPNKYSYIETGVILSPSVYLSVLGYTQQAPSNLTFNEEVFNNVKLLRIGWTRPHDSESVVGTAINGSISYITIAATGSANTNDYYKNWRCVITGGAGVGQFAHILSYNAITKLCIFTAPCITSTGLPGIALNSTSIYRLESPKLFNTTYTVKYSRDNLPIVTINNVDDEYVTLNHILPGIYSVWITATNARGISSPSLSGTFNYHSKTLSNLKSVTITTPSIFTTKDLSIAWTNPTDNINLTNGVDSPVSDYIVEIWDSTGITYQSTYIAENVLTPETFTDTIVSGTTTTAVCGDTSSNSKDYYKGWELKVISGGGIGQKTSITGYNDTTHTLTFTALTIPLGITSVVQLTHYLSNVNIGGKFIYNYQQNQTDFGIATRTIQVKVYARDLLLRKSIVNAQVFTNNVPASIPLSVSSLINQNLVAITSNTEVDVLGYQCWVSTLSNFVPDNTNLIYDGPDLQVVHPGVGGTTYYYKAAAYDSFGKTGLNISSEYSGTPLSVDAVSWSVLDIKFKQNNPVVNQISWTAGQISKKIGSTSSVYDIIAGSATWISGKLYIYYIGSGTTLSTTTLLTTATQNGAYIIGVYNGGVDFSFNGGDAFIDGSTLLAGTVGANALVAGSAIITGTAQIGIAVIDTLNLKHGSVLYNKSTSTANVFANVPRNTSAVQYQPSWVCPSPTGVGGPFFCTVNAYGKHRETIITAPESWNYTCIFNVQKYNPITLVWTDLPLIGFINNTEDHYSLIASSYTLVHQYYTVKGVTNYLTIDAPQTVNYVYGQDIIATATGNLSFLAVPGGIYRGKYTYWAKSVGKNTFGGTSNYSQGPAGFTFVVDLTQIGA